MATLDDDFDAAWGDPAGRTEVAVRTPRASSGTVDGRGPRAQARRHREHGRARPSAVARVGRRRRIVAAGLALLVVVSGTSLVVGALSERGRTLQVAAQPGTAVGRRGTGGPVAGGDRGGWPPPSRAGGPRRAGRHAAVGRRRLGRSAMVGRAARRVQRLRARPVRPGRTRLPARLRDRACRRGDEGPRPEGAGARADGLGSVEPPIVVTVLDATGRVVGSRALADGTDAAAPLAEGLVARVAREDGRATVTWEGALDGEPVRARVVVATDPAVRAVEEDSTGRIELLSRRGCSSCGRRTWPRPSTPPGLSRRVGHGRRRSGGTTAALPDGQRVRVSIDRSSGRTESVHVLGPDGRERFSIDGEPFVARVTDGSLPQVLVVRSPGFTGYDASTGRRLWHREEWPEAIWLQTNEVLVMESGSRLVALETRTGRLLWERWTPEEIRRAFADGDSVILSSQVAEGSDAPDGTDAALESIGLLDGRVEWRARLDPAYREVGSAQGGSSPSPTRNWSGSGEKRARYRVGDLSHR
ncbi:PQQ-binding-like beta-propeller repeat protein [Oerskovia sp. M15]